MRDFMRIYVLSMALLLAFVGVGQAQASRVALVIGNAQYSHVTRLENPANDATDMAAALKRIGFEVTLKRDLGDRDMRRALRDFGLAATRADIALIYYAGHGVQIDNTNYMIPVDAELRRDADVEFEALRLDSMLSAVNSAKGLKLVFIDACRDNPFLNQMTRTVATRSLFRGLSKIEPDGVVVGFAAKDGTQAFDGQGRNSPYAAALLAHLEEPGLELGKFFRKVRDTVLRATGGVQQPFVYGSLPAEDIYLVYPSAAPPVDETPQVAPAGNDGIAIATAFATADQAGTLAAWDSFLEAFGATTSHPLVTLAVARRDLAQEEADAARRQAEFEARIWLDAPEGRDGEVSLTLQQRRLVQEALNMAGFDTGGIDGQFGRKTRSAIAEAYTQYKLPARTFVDRNLLARLPNAIAMNRLISSTARPVTVSDLPSGVEPRLARAVSALNSNAILFDYWRGHLYIAVFQNTDWPTAQSNAQKAGGHLVTIGSREENNFVYRLFRRDARLSFPTADGTILGPYIGLFRRQNGAQKKGDWAWVTREAMTYTRWVNTASKNQREFAIYYRPASMRNRVSGPVFWHSVNGTTATSYVIEIE